MKKEPLVSIIIVNWNGEKWLKDCFESIYAQTYKNFEIVFVDNDSKDNSTYFVRKNFPKTKIIQNKKNLGFGVANNIAVKKSKGDILFFLNNDTKLFPETIRKLVRFKKKTKSNIIGPRILDLNKKDTLYNGFISIDLLGYPGPSINKLFYIEGCALMIDKKSFIELGGFDPKYFMYGEDVDLCWRAHLYNLKLAICESAKLVHFAGGSSTKTRYTKGKIHTIPIFRRYEVEKNNLRTILKNYKIINLFWIIPSFILQNIMESLLYLFTKNFKMFKIIFKALYWNLVNIKDTLKMRKVIQRKRIITDNKIIRKMTFKLNKLSMLMVMGVPKYK